MIVLVLRHDSAECFGVGGVLNISVVGDSPPSRVEVGFREASFSSASICEIRASIIFFEGVMPLAFSSKHAFATTLGFRCVLLLPVYPCLGQLPTRRPQNTRPSAATGLLRTRSGTGVLWLVVSEGARAWPHTDPLQELVDREHLARRRGPPVRQNPPQAATSASPACPCLLAWPNDRSSRCHRPSS